MPRRTDNIIWRTGKPYEWRKKKINKVEVGKEMITLWKYNI